MAGELEKSGASGGSWGSWGESFKRFSGGENAITELRQQYTRLRSSQVSKMLPPGTASDKDIAIVMSGFPSETANPNLVASFLRGMSKLNNIDAENKTAQAEWVNNVGHLGKSRQDMEVLGIKTPAGSSFPEFSSRYIQKLANNRASEAKLKSVENRSYMKYSGLGVR